MSPERLWNPQMRQVTPMPDVLVRGAREEVLAAIEAHAARLRLTRNEYLWRRLTQDARATGDETARAGDLRTFANPFADLAEPSVMRDGWS